MWIFKLAVVISLICSTVPQIPFPPPIGYCANRGICTTPVSCAPYYQDSLLDPTAPCYLAPGTPGVCCFPKQPTYPKREQLKRAENPVGSESPFKFDNYSLNHAAQVGILEVQWLGELEKDLSKRKIFVKKGSSAFNHFAFFKSKRNARQMADNSMTSIFGSQDLSSTFSLTPNQAGFGLTSFSTKNTLISDRCPIGGPCDKKTSYRSYDGTCNNLNNPLWGSSNSPFQRTLLPEYSDGVFTPREAKSGDGLPSARLVSINIIPDVDAPDQLDTHNVMQWGQFVDHDLTHTPLFRLNDQNSSGIQCCMEDGSATIDRLVLHPECFPIDIPSNDPFFSKFNQRCMNFVRSLPGPQQSCTFGYGEQQNQVTHLHDGSNVYGSDKEDALELRELNGGLLKTYKEGSSDSKGILPQEEGELEGEECGINDAAQRSQNRRCFKAGDSRSNEQPGLTAYHTVWVREHNRLASELSFLNPHWNDEKLYQESRKILVAELQHITYNEWLPIVLGSEFMDLLNILPIRSGYSDRYDTGVNPTIINSFSSAAFRFGHTLIQGMFDLVKDINHKRSTERMIPLSDTFLNPELIYVPGELDKFLVGLATQPRQQFDNIITEEVTNHLFQAKDKNFGMDLVALNIQRGRDHGIPGYNSFRELCGLHKVSRIDQFADIIPSEIVDRLKLIYDDVNDVDLFIGGISESPAPGALVGPTFQCLIGDQFQRTQHGDRYYYDSDSNGGPFTEDQLAEIRQSNLARITCDNGDNIKQMQPLAFRKPTVINPLLPCDAITIPIINLAPWKDGYTSPVKVQPLVRSLPDIRRPSSNLFSQSSSLRFQPKPAPTAPLRFQPNPAPTSPLRFQSKPAPTSPHRFQPKPAPTFQFSRFRQPRQFSTNKFAVSEQQVKPFVNLNVNYAG